MGISIAGKGHLLARTGLRRRRGWWRTATTAAQLAGLGIYAHCPKESLYDDGVGQGDEKKQTEDGTHNEKEAMMPGAYRLVNRPVKKVANRSPADRNTCRM